MNTGLTLDYVLSELREREPASVEVVTLLDRPLRRLVKVPIKYVGFQIPNDYVVGYGLDYRELYRNLPFICVLRPGVYQDLAPRSLEGGGRAQALPSTSTSTSSRGDVPPGKETLK